MQFYSILLQISERFKVIKPILRETAFPMGLNHGVLNSVGRFLKTVEEWGCLGS